MSMQTNVKYITVIEIHTPMVDINFKFQYCDSD